MSDIVERLKGPRTEQGGLWPHPNLHEEAAAEIEKLRDKLADEEYVSKDLEEMFQSMRGEADALRSENEKLRAALKPFADKIDYCTGTKDSDYMDAVFTLGEVRAAVKALENTK